MGCRIRVWDAGCRVQDTVLDWDMGCRTFGAGSGYGCKLWVQDQFVGWPKDTAQDRERGIAMQGAWCRMWGVGHRIWDMGYGMQGAGSAVGCRISRGMQDQDAGRH